MTMQQPSSSPPPLAPVLTPPDEVLVALPSRTGCWFCLKGRHEVKKLIGGATSALICDECIGLCIEMLGLRVEPVTLQDQALLPGEAPP